MGAAPTRCGTLAEVELTVPRPGTGRLTELSAAEPGPTEARSRHRPHQRFRRPERRPLLLAWSLRRPGGCSSFSRAAGGHLGQSDHPQQTSPAYAILPPWEEHAMPEMPANLAELTEFVRGIAREEIKEQPRDAQGGSDAPS